MSVSTFILATRERTDTRWKATTVAADMASHVAAYAARGSAHIVTAPTSGVWHVHYGTPERHGAAPFAIVYSDTPHQRSDFSVPSDAPARIVLAADGSVIIADGRSW